MATVPPPPASPPRALQPGDTRRLAAGTCVWRVYFSGGAHPASWSGFRHFGPTTGRFDHHLPDANGQPAAQNRGIQYAAAGATTCLAEVFQDTRVIERRTDAPRLAGYALTRDVELLDLGSGFITGAGASPAICAVRRGRARDWSRYLCQHYPAVDGLHYPSSMYRHAGAYALYERAADAMPPAPLFDRALADPVLTALLAAAASRLGYALV